MSSKIEIANKDVIDSIGIKEHLDLIDPSEQFTKFDEGAYVITDRPDNNKVEKIENKTETETETVLEKSKYDPSSNKYYDVAKTINKQDFQSAGDTGSGAESALGTEYSWNKTAGEKANSQYKADVESAKQNALDNAESINTNAVNYQVQADMNQYKLNQEAEKVGWAGGYVLDQNRQNEYLKQSIQAQMYGAMELQKYGYDSALAAARLSYDLNMTEYAQTYYNQAVQNSLNEAQITGTYFSAETKDMMAQLSTAKQIINSGSSTQDEIDRATKIQENIERWFETNGVSKAGVTTLAAWEADQTNNINWNNQLWSQYEAAYESAKSNIEDNATAFIMLDTNGNPIYNGSEVQVGDWQTMSDEEKLAYGGSSSTAKSQLYSYLNSLVEQTISGYIASVSTISNGNTVVNATKKGVKEALAKTLSETFKNISDKDAENILNEWVYTTTADTVTLNNLTVEYIKNLNSESGQEPEGEDSDPNVNGQDSSSKYKNPSVMIGNIDKFNKSFAGYEIGTKLTDNQGIVWTVASTGIITVNVQDFYTKSTINEYFQYDLPSSDCGDGQIYYIGKYNGGVELHDEQDESQLEQNKEYWAVSGACNTFLILTM